VPNEQRRALEGLVIYFGVLVAGSAVFETLLLQAGDSIRNHVALVLPLMWMPAIASAVARLALGEGFQDVSFRLGGVTGMRMLLVAWLFALLIGGLAYGLAWGAGLAEFVTPEVPGLPHLSEPIAAFAALVGIRLTIGVPIAAIAAAGEEIGWRGYMLTRMIEARVPHPVFWGGLVWAAWHLPLILGGVYAAGSYRVASAGLFCVSIVSLAYVLAYVRLKSGSVWPAIVGHAAWNATLQGVFDFSTAPDPNKLWIGESGLLVASASACFAWLVARRRWTMQRAPGVPLESANG
jgi:membrane protease YdiL (CAAX protease family)